MNRKILHMAALALVAMACSRDEVDAPASFVVTPSATTVAAGSDVTFSLAGDPDYIVFFSGEEGEEYAYRDRTEADVDALVLSANVRQQYNDRSYFGTPLLHAYVSTDYSGEDTPEALAAATWMPISGSEAALLPMPVATAAAAVETSGAVDLGNHISPSEPFFLAFLYSAAGRDRIPTANNGSQASYITKPRVDVTNLTLAKTLSDGQCVELTNAATDFGFRFIMESSVGATFQITDGGMLFQPKAATINPATGRETDEKVWAVSAPINPRKVDPDEGTPIKSIEAPLKSYTHTYRTPGRYVATFVATNANMWNGKSKVVNLEITVE